MNERVSKKSGAGGKIATVLMVLLLVIVIGVNIAGGIYFNVITQFLSSAEVDEEETEEMNINVFGWSSIAPVYGGTGSGGANEDQNVTFLQGLANAGFNVNEELVEFYEGLGYERGANTSLLANFSHDFTVYEAETSDYDETLLSNAEEFSDVALIYIARLGGEGADLPMDMSEWGDTADKHALELSTKERAMIDMVEAMDFEKVIVIVNSSNVMELGFLEEEGIDAALWIGGPGVSGMNSVGKILSGEVNPSGRLADTYAYDLTANPAYYNFGLFTYTNGDVVEPNTWTGEDVTSYHHFVEYAEGIYVGYRYYETRWIDNATGECDEEAYQAAVQYPFGYGLSYTTFEQEITGFEADDEEITVEVTVTNTGDTAGKETAEVYYTAPYYTGGIEKSHVVLAGFEKTQLLEPGESEVLTVTFATDDMASFDYAGEGCYVLDAGTYEIKLMRNAHEVIDSRTYEVAEKVVFDENNPRSTDETAATVQFADAAGDVQYVSRADWEGTLPAERTQDREASQEILDSMTDYTVPEEEAEDIVIQDNGLALEDMIGLEYDDPQWDSLLEQLSVEDMQNLIGMGGFATLVVESVDKPYAIDLDGPAGINSLVNETRYASVQYPSAVLIASTWNKELIYELGDAYGAEAEAWGVSGLYAPAMNIHRLAFGGRSFEYYSEDGLLSGKIAANMIAGIQSNGVYCFMKHFAMNDQEEKSQGDENSTGIATWSNEQAIREIYLRPFEIAVKEGGARGAMSAFNRIGTTWCGASYSLLTTVLRGEWGFEGMVITDFDGYDYMNPDQAIRAGNDLMLTPVGDAPQDTSNAGKQAMRQACHNILYTVANSNAMEIGYYGPQPYWFYALIVVDVLVAAGEILFFVKKFRKRKAVNNTGRKE